MPLLINYRGYVDVSDPGLGLATGALTVGLQFDLYDTPVIEGATPLWSELQTAQLFDGNFAVMLGNITPLSLDLFASNERYLTVSIDSTLVAGPQQILSVPYALQAGHVYSAPNGWVGIGTTSPSAKLDVQGSVRSANNLVADNFVESTGNGFKFPDGSIQTTSAFGSGYSLDAEDGEPADALYVDATGQVGIGTTLPQSLLHLSGEGPVELLLEADSDNDLIGDATDHPVIRFSQDGGMVQGKVGYLEGEDNVLGMVNEYQSVHADLVFGTSDTERMRITADGHIGIGTDTPSVELEVHGDIRLGENGESYAPGSPENLRFIRGNVHANGSVLQGEGFTVLRYGTGRYAVYFDTPFSDTPSVTVVTGDLGGEDDNVANIRTLNKDKMDIYICDVTGGHDNAENSWFSFIVVGPR